MKTCNECGDQATHVVPQDPGGDQESFWCDRHGVGKIDSRVMVYGLWHEGWCTFRTTRNPDHIGYGHSGTAEEVELGRQQFINDGQDPAAYAVATFDPERDPTAIEGQPTPAQLDMLEYVERAWTINRWPMPKNWRTTAAVLSRNGWFTSNVGPDGQEVPKRVMRLTPAGLRALRAGREAGSEKSSQE